MNTAAYSLAELCIAQCAEVWRGEGEVLATGIGIIPRIAAGLARLTFRDLHWPRVADEPATCGLARTLAFHVRDDESRAGWSLRDEAFVWSVVSRAVCWSIGSGDGRKPGERARG